VLICQILLLADFLNSQFTLSEILMKTSFIIIYHEAYTPRTIYTNLARLRDQNGIKLRNGLNVFTFKVRIINNPLEAKMWYFLRNYL
jgi:hypothetical protein